MVLNASYSFIYAEFRKETCSADDWEEQNLPYSASISEMDSVTLSTGLE
jgi:hypothetical protein